MPRVLPYNRENPQKKDKADFRIGPNVQDRLTSRKRAPKPPPEIAHSGQPHVTLGLPNSVSLQPPRSAKSHSIYRPRRPIRLILTRLVLWPA